MVYIIVFFEFIKLIDKFAYNKYKSLHSNSIWFVIKNSDSSAVHSARWSLRQLSRAIVIQRNIKFFIVPIFLRKNKLSRLTTEESIDYLGSPKEILNERWKLLSLPQKDEYNYYTVNRSNASNIINKMSLGLESIDVNDLVECVKIVSGLCCKKVQICGYN